MAKKAKDRESLQEMSAKELQARLEDVQESRFRLQFRHATSPLKNPMEIRHVRRQIARLKTVIRMKAGI